VSGGVPDAVTENAAVCPAVTVWFAGSEVIVREGPAALPVPLAWISARGVEALPITDRVAEALPAARGVKLEVNEALCPASRVNGIAGPVTLKTVPETETPDIVMDMLPVFLSTRLCRSEEPTAT
jgi:hypothetical protein